MKDLYLEIVSPEKVLFKDNISLVEVPGKRGRFTILQGHAPIISALEKGVVRVKLMNGDEQTFDCPRGYLECSDNKVSILMN